MQSTITGLTSPKGKDDFEIPARSNIGLTDCDLRVLSEISGTPLSCGRRIIFAGKPDSESLILLTGSSDGSISSYTAVLNDSRTAKLKELGVTVRHSNGSPLFCLSDGRRLYVPTTSDSLQGEYPAIDDKRLTPLRSDYLPGSLTHKISLDSKQFSSFSGRLLDASRTLQEVDLSSQLPSRWVQALGHTSVSEGLLLTEAPGTFIRMQDWTKKIITEVGAKLVHREGLGKGLEWEGNFMQLPFGRGLAEVAISFRKETSRPFSGILEATSATHSVLHKIVLHDK